MDVIELCNWRYATKKMLPGQAVPAEKVERILEAARLAPSSSGLQPYEVLVIADPALREQIRPLAKGQAQISDCSHLLVFAAWDTYTPELIRRAFEQTRRDRGELSAGLEPRASDRHRPVHRRAAPPGIVRQGRIPRRAS